MQCGIQLTTSARVRDAHSGLVTVCRVVTTGVSCTGGGGSSTLTASVDAAFAVPLPATTCSTYSPGKENVAVVIGAFASANVTSPGPETLLHVVDGAGPAGSGAAVAAPRPPRPRRG